MDFELIQLIILFGIIAIFYSSAGFGGGSSYLAVLALVGYSFPSVKMLALLCNITVVLGSVILMYRHQFLHLKKSLPLIVLSVPLAYFGGQYNLDQKTFFIVLGICLLLSALFMFFFDSNKSYKKRNISIFKTGIIGGGIGFLSGMVGIGGGIFLSPILHLSQWATVKQIAATTAFFILVNSIAGLVGQFSTHGLAINPTHALSLMLAVFIGGQIGIRLTIKKLNPLWIKKITAILIFIVAIRILYENLVLS